MTSFTNIGFRGFSTVLKIGHDLVGNKMEEKVLRAPFAIPRNERRDELK
jgi:hypothetical protein